MILGTKLSDRQLGDKSFVRFLRTFFPDMYTRNMVGKPGDQWWLVPFEYLLDLLNINSLKMGRNRQTQLGANPDAGSSQVVRDYGLPESAGPSWDQLLEAQGRFVWFVHLQKPSKTNIWVYFWGVGKPGTDGKRGEVHQTDGLVTGIALE